MELTRGLLERVWTLASYQAGFRFPFIHFCETPSKLNKLFEPQYSHLYNWNHDAMHWDSCTVHGPSAKWQCRILCSSNIMNFRMVIAEHEIKRKSPLAPVWHGRLHIHDAVPGCAGHLSAGSQIASPVYLCISGLIPENYISTGCWVDLTNGRKW